MGTTAEQKTIFICADHGLAIIYFLQSDVVKTLLEKRIRVVLLTDDGLTGQIQQRFGAPGLQAVAVDRRVNDARNQGADLLAPLGSHGPVS